MPTRSATRSNAWRRRTDRWIRPPHNGSRPIRRPERSMAELGETHDPRALIPGDPDAIAANAGSLRDRARDAADAGDGLRKIDSGSWTGAAAQKFHEKFSYEPGRWFTAGDAMQGGAGALDDYVATLRWAQHRAAEAIGEWDQAQAAPQHPKPDHAPATTAAQQAGQPEPPFTDPGTAGRDSAQALLKDARNQL